MKFIWSIKPNHIRVITFKSHITIDCYFLCWSKYATSNLQLHQSTFKIRLSQNKTYCDCFMECLDCLKHKATKVIDFLYLIKCFCFSVMIFIIYIHFKSKINFIAACLVLCLVLRFRFYPNKFLCRLSIILTNI